MTFPLEGLAKLDKHLPPLACMPLTGCFCRLKRIQRKPAYTRLYLVFFPDRSSVGSSSSRALSSYLRLRLQSALKKVGGCPPWSFTLRRGRTDVVGSGVVSLPLAWLLEHPIGNLKALERLL